MRRLRSADLEIFNGIIADRLGLHFGEGKGDFLTEVLQRRLAWQRQPSVSTYLDHLAADAETAELSALAQELTVTETYFFRSPDHFRVLVESAVPERLRTPAGRRHLSFLSAGCASGEEAYSLAILLCEHFPALDPGTVRILGVDVNPAMIASAQKGRYCAWSLRDTPDQIRSRYFHREGQEFVIDERIRAMVTFEQGNLARGSCSWSSIEGEFDVVLCRNVLMYLAPDAAREAIARISKALRPGGYLFLGYAETLRGVSQDYRLRRSQESFYYQRRNDTERAPANPAPPDPECSIAACITSVQQATDRIHHLSRVSSAVKPVMSHGDKNGLDSSPPVRQALELLREEKFCQALQLLESMGPEAVRDSDTQLLRAVLLMNCGNPAAAEVVCRQVLLRDELNASAHYLAGLCRESAGDFEGATEHVRAAIYLDPEFAMPRLSLGRFSKRTGDLVGARRELRQAETLFMREDPLRILFFGGGFSREALVESSRAEFRACGGRS